MKPQWGLGQDGQPGPSVMWVLEKKGWAVPAVDIQGMVQVIGLCSYVSWCLKWATDLGGLGPLVTFRAIALCGDHLTSAGNSLSPCSVWFPDFAVQISHLENFAHPETWCHILQSLGLRARHYFCCCYCCLRFLGKFKVALDPAIKSKSIHVCVYINLIWGLREKKKMCVHAQFYPTLLGPVDCGLPGSSVHGKNILQARRLEWVAISYFRGSSWPRVWTCISCVSGIGWQILYHWHHLGSPEKKYCPFKQFFCGFFSLLVIFSQLYRRWGWHKTLCRLKVLIWEIFMLQND